MISPTIYGTKILDAFLNTKNLDSIYVDEQEYSGKIDPKKRNRVIFGTDVYIGLLTKMPTATGIGWAEPTAKEYQRFKLNRNSTTTNNPILSSHIPTEEDQATTIVTMVTPLEGGEEVEVTDTVKAAYVINDDNIIFPEVSSSLTEWGGESEGGPGRIVGFALFSTDKGGDPFFWGEVRPDKDSGEIGVEIKLNEVPIIRKSEFKVTVT